MKLFFLISFCSIICFFSNAQVDYSENLWMSSLINCKLNKELHLTSDFGFRTYDNFIKKNRTFLARILIEKPIKEKHFFGIGQAFFDHFSPSKINNEEHRPFLQYRYKIQVKDFDIQARFRNEFRFFTSKNEFFNRIRFQVQLKYNLFKGKISPVISAETFISSGKNSLREGRLSFGVANKISEKFSGFLFYTFQKQSSYFGNQHILGIQLQINLKSKNERN